MMDMQTYATALEVVYIFRELEEIRKYREDVHAGASQIMMTGGNGLSIWLNTCRGSLVRQKLWETLLRELDSLIEKYEKELKELLKDESSRMVETSEGGDQKKKAL